MSTPLLEARNLRKSYAGIEALKGVSFELLAGEVHALVGENDAGKSTLIKILTGAVEPDEGSIALRGQRITRNSPVSARSLGIAAIYQQPTLFPDLSVEENIALSVEGSPLWRFVDWKKRRANAVKLLEKVGAKIDPDRPVRTLSMPDQQIVAIAKALGSEAKILILDEPTASLTDREVERLFDLIRTLRTERAGVIYVSHRIEEIHAIADRITILRDGENVGTWLAGELTRPSLIEKMAGRPVAAVFPKRSAPVGEVGLELRGLSSERAGVHNVSLSVHRGEIMGLAGLVGSGRTELAQTIFGLTPADSGEIMLFGKPVRIRSPREAIEQRIGHLPEDRRAHGLVLEMPIYANTSLATLKRLSCFGLLRRREERELAGSFIERLGVKCPSADVEAGSLSGGNQQKVALARWLAGQPEILILDEPTQGVDVASKAEIHALVTDLAAQGMTILMISSDLLEIIGMSDRIAVMRGGKIAGILSRAEATRPKILSLALGHPIQERPAIIPRGGNEEG